MNIHSSIAISKVANGYIVSLPVFASPYKDDDFFTQARILKEVMNEDEILAAAKKKQKTRPPEIPVQENIFIFDKLENALAFINFKLSENEPR